jgi:hypothetical protein
MHAIGVPEDVTLLEFDGTRQEAPEVQQPEPGVREVQATGEVPDEVASGCPDHTPCNFMKGKPRSIISLLISKMQLNIMLYIYVVALSFRCWMKTNVALISNP